MASSGCERSISASTATRELASPVSTAVVRVTPTSNDAVVAAVRRGFRTALAAASRPAIPSTGRSARPPNRTRAGITTGPSSSSPVKLAAPPTTITGTTATATARASRAAPAPTSPRPAAIRQRPAGVPASTPRSGCRAVCGLSVATRRVGTQAAASETSTPTTYAPASQSGEFVAEPKGAFGSRFPASATRP